MKTRNFSRVVTWVALMVTLIVNGATLASFPALADPVTSAFTYQGLISYQGQPLNGSADFQFGLWDAATGGGQIGSTLSINGVTVTNGVFASLLDFGVSAFNGDARWLEITVRTPSGGGVFTTLTPRVNITPTPYSLETRGIVVDNAGDVTIGTPPAFQRPIPHGSIPGVPMSSPHGSQFHVIQVENGTGDAAILGEATAPSGVGVFGSTASATGEGMHGEGATGVHGISTTGGEGVVGEGTRGMRGSSSDPAGEGIKGEATASTGNAIGVHGTSTAASGEGMRGEGKTGAHGVSSDPAGEGIKGEATAGSGSAIGVHGTSAATLGEGMRGEGKTGVHGVSSTQGGEGIVGEGTRGMRGSSSDPAGEGIKGEATASSGSAIGVHGTSAATLGEGMRGEGATGIHGVSTASGGKGIVGETSASNGTAIYGVANDSSATAIAVYGRSGAPGGFAGYFMGRAYVRDKLGIGTTTPAAKLDIAGVSGVDGIRFPDGSIQTTAAASALWQTNGTSIYYNNGKVGVGTSTPGARIDAEDPTSTAIYASSQGSNSPAVYAIAGGTYGQGVQAAAQGANGIAVIATAFGTNCTAVYGNAPNPSAGSLTYGVGGVVASPNPAAAGVLAQGNGTAAPGLPNGAALDIRNGAIRMSTSGTQPGPAGTITVPLGSQPWTPIKTCKDAGGQVNTFGYVTTLPLSNNYIVSNSMVFVTVEVVSPVAPALQYSAYVSGKQPGAMQIDVNVLGTTDVSNCPMPTGTINIHYLIVNPY